MAFKRVVKDYPKTLEAKESLDKIKKIYIDKGQLAPYEEYLASIGGADSSLMVLDADYYEVAENSYMRGDCEKAVNDLTKYIEKYSSGAYLLNARYYKADCENRSGFINEALIDYEFVLNQPKNKFTEMALLKSALINTDLGNTEKALENYSKLEYLADIQENVFKAQVAQMRLNFELKNYDAAVKYAELIINKDIDDALLITEAHLIYAKSMMDQDDYNLALKEFTTASTSANKFGAEAKYYVAYILYLRGENDNCETEVFSLVKKFPSYGYWIGKALILLADNYVAKEDLFQAKVTLQNVIDHSKFPELVNTASEKLAIIEQDEAKKEPTGKEEDLNLDLIEDMDFEKLFEEETPEEEVIPQNNNEFEQAPDEKE